MVETSVDISTADKSPENQTQQQDSTNEVAPIPSPAILNNIHPLKHKWTLWFLNSKKDLDWVKRLNNVCTFSSVEEFWSLYDSIRPPSVLPNCDYNLFKEGIEPMWEVPQNKNGGRLIVVVEKSRTDLLDQWWLELLIALIGEQFGDDSDEICGAVCNIRQKGSKISLWTTNASNVDANTRIGKIMKDRLMAVWPGYKNTLKVCYEDHSDVQSKTSSAIQSRIII
ncbi:eukaryotic initiation factor 4E domain-containing protein [Ditylenchus destructor]|uniref:Eukaryotic initiation factor 4E domain-containing protein n=1 Tax=Ditylenchus destructor TaxID=166010 RepID=A0AAD4N5C2_9BILA|nr:eukaryotic initiation factor 4E domain-containing protein [Ditylenchus destructor]